jgi:hypothetical protein
MPLSHRAAAAFLCAVSGFFVILAMGADFKGSDRASILAATLGAMVGGLLCANLFGRPGHAGNGFAILGAALSTIMGAALAGLVLGATLAHTLAGFIVGPLAVGYALVTSPLACAVWVITMAIVHLVMRKARSDTRLFV